MADPRSESAVDVAGSLAFGVVEVAVPILAVGVVAMALVQAVNVAFALRARFLRRQLAQWLPADEARDALVRLASGRDTPDWTFYEQDPEALFRAIVASAEASIESPERYPAIYRALAAEAGDDMQVWANQAAYASLIPPREDARRDQKLEEARRAVESKRRVTRLVMHRIETFRQYCLQRWAWWARIASVAVGAALLLPISGGLVDHWAAHFRGISSHAPRPLLQLGASLLAGLVAPVAKDFLSAWTHRRTAPGGTLSPR